MAKHTPVELVVLIQIHYIPLIYIKGTISMAERKAIEKWQRCKMIDVVDGHSANGYETTRKGKFFIDYLCAQPIPVEESSYHIPKPKEG
jgi:hypothetical protein